MRSPTPNTHTHTSPSPQLERSAALTHEEVEDAVWRHDDMLAGVERFFQEVRRGRAA